MTNIIGDFPDESRTGVNICAFSVSPSRSKENRRIPACRGADWRAVEEAGGEGGEKNRLAGEVARLANKIRRVESNAAKRAAARKTQFMLPRFAEREAKARARLLTFDVL